MDTAHISEEVVLKILMAGIRAPSGHNTQPWLIGRENNRIILSPDLTRNLPEADPDNHALYISLGCALENMVITAEHHGFQPDVMYQKDRHQIHIHIRLLPGIVNKSSDLYPQIQRRQVSRGPYAPEKISNNVWKRIQSIPAEAGIRMHLFSKDEGIQSLKPYIFQAISKQYSDRKFIHELLHWMRFRKREAIFLGDGLWSRTMGLPDFGKGLGKFIMKPLLKPGRERKRWDSLLKHSGGFVLFLTDTESDETMIRLGRTFQRFGLTATSLNLSHSHVNMPCEVREIRHELRKIYHGSPMLLIRLGYGKSMPYSYRRHLKHFILKQERK